MCEPRRIIMMLAYFSNSAIRNILSSKTHKIISWKHAGMPKEVLLKYSRQRGFVWARNILAIAVVLTILTLLSMVIALIAVSPACQEFWQTSPIYQIYPKSFSDSDSSSYGDINGWSISKISCLFFMEKYGVCFHTFIIICVFYWLKHFANRAKSIVTRNC